MKLCETSNLNYTIQYFDNAKLKYKDIVDLIIISMSLQYKKEIIQQVRIRIIEESIPRIKQCLEKLSEEQVWYKVNSNTNAVGNLVLHLCGNVRQWIMHGLGGQKDIRERDLEFSLKGNLSKAQLLNKLDVLAIDLELVLEQLVDHNLLERKTVQKHFHESGVSILFHVTEHFSYHTGQITYFTKMTKNIDTAYYGKLDL